MLCGLKSVHFSYGNIASAYMNLHMGGTPQDRSGSYLTRKVGIKGLVACCDLMQLDIDIYRFI